LAIDLEGWVFSTSQHFGWEDHIHIDLQLAV